MGEKILNSYKIFNQCIVYQNNEFDSNAILDTIKNSEELGEGYLIEKWEDWYQFGKKSRFLDPRKEVNKFTEQLDNLHTDAFFKIKNFMNKCVEDYVKNYLDEGERSYPEYVNFSSLEKGQIIESLVGQKIVTPDNTSDPSFQHPVNGWIENSYDILKHRPFTNAEYAIGWHTDRLQGLEYSPGPKPILTLTLYLNDDYEGGEVAFLKDGEEKIIIYKPKAGDVVVFPSSNPFQHAAMPILSQNSKYFIRHFLTWTYPGSQEWNDSADKFGIDKWIEMENERVQSEILAGKGRKHVVMPGGLNSADKKASNNSFYSESQLNGEDYYIKDVVYIDGRSLQK